MAVAQAALRALDRRPRLLSARPGNVSYPFLSTLILPGWNHPLTRYTMTDAERWTRERGVFGGTDRDALRGCESPVDLRGRERRRARPGDMEVEHRPLHPIAAVPGPARNSGRRVAGSIYMQVIDLYDCCPVHAAPGPVQRFASGVIASMPQLRFRYSPPIVVRGECLRLASAPIDRPPQYDRTLRFGGYDASRWLAESPLSS